MLAQLTLTKGSFRSSGKVSVFRATVNSAAPLKSHTGFMQLRMNRQAAPKSLLSMFEAANARFVTRVQMRPILASSRLLHTSLGLQKKSTTALRRERAASAPVPSDTVKAGVLFEKDSRTFFLVLTGISLLQAVFFLTSAEFYWQYDVSVVDGMNAGSDFLSRLMWPAFFVSISTFLPITRYFFGTRYVNKLELLQDKTVNVWTYDLLARPKVSLNVPVDAFKYGAFNDQGDYYKFKIRGQRWFFIMDKKGSVPDPAALYEVANGKLPQTRF